MSLSPGFALALLALLTVAYCLVDATDLSRVAPLAVIAAGCAVFSRTRARTLMSRLLPLGAFVLVAAVLALLAPVQPGETALQVPHWHRPVSPRAVAFLLAVAVKSGLVVVTMTAFLELLGERGLLVGMKGLPVPERVADLTYFTMRSVSSVRDEVVRMVRARDARGKARGLRSIATVSAMSRVLLVRLARRADTQACALWARGFDGRLPLFGQAHISAAEVGLLVLLASGLAWISLAL